MDVRRLPRRGSKRWELLFWMKMQKKATTSEVIRWGTDNFTNRADRDARLLAEMGWLKRMSQRKKNRIYGKNMHQEVWEYVR